MNIEKKNEKSTLNHTSKINIIEKKIKETISRKLERKLIKRNRSNV